MSVTTTSLRLALVYRIAELSDWISKETDPQRTHDLEERQWELLALADTFHLSRKRWNEDLAKAYAYRKLPPP